MGFAFSGDDTGSSMTRSLTIVNSKGNLHQNK